jgi:hypothetical protein
MRGRARQRNRRQHPACFEIRGAWTGFGAVERRCKGTASGTMGATGDGTDALYRVKVTLLLLPKITRSFLKPWTDGVHTSDARMQESLRDPANNLKTVALPQTHSSSVCTHDEVDCIATPCVLALVPPERYSRTADLVSPVLPTRLQRSVLTAHPARNSRRTRTRR